MKIKKIIGVLTLVLMVALAAGCGLSGSQDRKNEANNEPPKVDEQAQQNKDETNTPPVNPKPTQENVEVTLYFSDNQAMYLVPEKRIVAKAGKPMAELLVEELIKGGKDGQKTIPDGTKLLSLEVSDGVAFVNFSKEIKTNHWGGTAGERMTSQSIVLTLTQLPEIEKVQFLIEGKTEEAIWGHAYTGEPIGPEKDLIAK